MRQSRSSSVPRAKRWGVSSVSLRASATLTLATHLQDCNRFFPQSVSDSIFAEAGPSPQHLGNGPAWSWYGDGTFITATPPDNGAPEVHLPENLATGFSPASVTDCITACQSLSGANVAGVVFIPSEKHCTCTIGRIDTDTIAVSRPRTYRSPFAPLPVEMVVFKDCVTTTGLREFSIRSKALTPQAVTGVV